MFWFQGSLLQFSQGLQLSIGDCPVYFEEPCDSKAIRFLLNTKTRTKKINPYHPIFPKDSTPIKILVHGYGGLTIDYAIKNVSAAYNKLGYNTIIGISHEIKENIFLTTFFVLNFSWLEFSSSSAVLCDGFLEHMARGSVHSGAGYWSPIPRCQAGRTARDRFQFGSAYSWICR